MLGIHDLGGKLQVVRDRVAVRQLAQARCAVGEQAGDLGQQDAGETGLVQRFDFAGLKNALLHRNRGPEIEAAGTPSRGRPAAINKRLSDFI